MVVYILNRRGSKDHQTGDPRRRAKGEQPGQPSNHHHRPQQWKALPHLREWSFAGRASDRRCNNQRQRRWPSLRGRICLRSGSQDSGDISGLSPIGQLSPLKCHCPPWSQSTDTAKLNLTFRIVPLDDERPGDNHPLPLWGRVVPSLW